MRFATLLALTASAAAQETRDWTDRQGRSFSAQLVACDALRATLNVGGRGKIVVALKSLSAADADFARHWRLDNPRAPLIDTGFLPAWPADAVAAPVTVQLVAPNDSSFNWESAHFRIGADLRLPLGIVRDLAAVLEATREVLLSVPLGLHAGGERSKYPVLLFSDVTAYGIAGGAAGSGGSFNGHELLILLPNLGIKPGTNGLTAEHSRNLFVLKHEAVHQLLKPWGWVLPVWLDEGFAECVASWPYTQGRYSLQNLDSALHDYLLKWRRSADRRALRIIAPSTLLRLSRDEWRAQVAAQSAYDHYNSAALVTHYFLRHDGRGDSAGLAAYFDAMRRGVSPREAEATHLTRGRTPAQMTSALQKLARALGIEATIE